MSITGPDRFGPAFGDATGGADPAAAASPADAAPVAPAPRSAPARAAAVPGPAPGEDPRAFAARAADRLRAAPDRDKPALLAGLEALGGAGHDGWLAVYDSRPVVEAVAAVVHDTLDPAVEGRAARFLLKVYRDHFDDDGPASSALKNAATDGLCDTYGSEVLPTVLRMTGDERLARAIVERAEGALRHPMIRAADNTPLLEEMGIDGSGSTVMVIDAAGSDHMAHTSYLASPERAGSRVIPFGADETSGRPFLETIARALDSARAQGVNVVSISAGASFEGRDREDYIRRAGGDERAARAAYDRDVNALRGMIEAFPGVVIVAAGNDGAGGQPNDLARSPEVVVAGALDPSERRRADFTSPAHHPGSVLGAGTAVFAPGAGGDMRFIEDATSWAAPQIAHFAACVFQAGRQFDQPITPAEVREVLKKTAEPAEGSRRADVVAAVRFAKTLAYVKSTGDARLLAKLRDLPPGRAREVGARVEPLLHALHAGSRAEIAKLIGG